MPTIANRAIWALLLTAGTTLLLSSSAGAVEKTWYTQQGTWSDPSNWRPVGVPWEYDTAIVNQGQAQISTQDAEVGKLWIANTAGSVGAVSVASGRALVLHTDDAAGALCVGGAGSGTFYQSGNVSGYTPLPVSIGSSSTGTGVYLLQSGAVLSHLNLYVGDAGCGSFARAAVGRLRLHALLLAL